MAEGSLQFFSPYLVSAIADILLRTVGQRNLKYAMLCGANEDLLLLICLVVNTEPQHVLFL